MELEKLRAFINDASAIVRYFGIAMAKSAPHVYLSALPFAPTRSLVSAHYSSSFPRTLRVKRGGSSHWPSSEMVISNVGGRVHSIAFSPNRQRIVSGSDDGTIRVWNATTGETEAGLFTGHTSFINSVTFSPDGQHIVSGIEQSMCGTPRRERQRQARSLDRRIWSRLAFSPVGQRIVSGSEDGTICV